MRSPGLRDLWLSLAAVRDLRCRLRLIGRLSSELFV
jgi:hypothetical protein